MAELAKDAKISRRRSRFGRILALALIVAILAVGGYYLRKYFSTYETTDDAQVDGHIDAVSSRINGHVMDVLVEDEQYVKAGDLLVRIDPKDYEVAVAK